MLSLVYVDHDAGGAGNGTSWADAYTDLRVALAEADSGDEVWVAEGTYTPSSSGNRWLSFNLKTGVDVYGGFDGSENSREERDSAGHVTTLSGDIGITGDISDNSYHVVYAIRVTDAILDGFTITAGNANGALGHHHGGGMFNSLGSPTLTNVTFSGNSAHICGGGMFNELSYRPTLTNVTFSSNSATWGGGVYYCDSSPRLTNVIFSGNSAYGGGGMYNCDNSSPTLNNVAFSGNSASFGGGMYNYDNSSPTLTNVAFSGNSADMTGGAMYNVYDSAATLTNCILWGNRARHAGSEIYDASAIAPPSTVNYSIVAGGWTGSGNLHADPLFVRPPNAGADGTWGTADDDFGDLRLTPGSPAVDGGDPNFDPNDFSPPLVTDQRGAPRVLDGNGDGNAIVDMGAFELVNADWGDAPASYPTLLADEGAYHILATGPRLGTERDWEPDGQPAILADGDDLTGTLDDEDGVPTAPLLVPGTVGTTLTVEASSASFLNAWIDYNADGDWDDPGEQVAVDVALNAGSNKLSLDVPASAVLGRVYARLRLTSYDTGGTLAPTGPADDGEVEDYAWTTENYLDLIGRDAVADSITIWVGSPGGFYHQVKINGTVSHYDAAVYNAIRIDGFGGNDTITIYGTNQDETVTLQPGSASVVGQTYALYVTGIETITVDAGLGNDQVTMTGSAASNRLYSYGDYSRMTDSARSFSHRVDGFETLTVDVSGGSSNSAYLYDSPDKDELVAEPDTVTFTRSAGSATETETTAIGFQQVYAYATTGDDTAALTGSDAAQNRLYSYADYSLLTEARRSFYFYLRGFDSVTATSPGSLTAYAYLYDSPGVDELNASVESANMIREDPWSDTIATGFTKIYAYSTRGGADSAVLNGSTTGGNYLRAYPTYSTLYDASRSFYHYARGFHSVTTAGAKDNPSSDRAYLYDSPGADTFNEAFQEEGKYQGGSLTDVGDSYEIWIKYFDLVYARSTDSGTNDTIAVDEELLAYRLLRMGTW